MDRNAVIDELRAPTRGLRQAIPEAWAAFTDLHRAAVGDGVVPTRIKEAVAQALSVNNGCDGCIAFHARAAARAGATREDVAEVLAVTLLMNGGPATIYAPGACEASQQFRTEGR
jgi:AhpD family alkylhydroperoxidase